MPADETAGVAAVAKLLARVAEEPGRTVAELAAELDLSRSTAFAVVATLDASALVERDAAGRLRPGPEAGRLFLARYGFGSLAEPAEALMPVLRDDTDASVSLVISDGSSAFVALRRRAPWDRGAAAASRLIEASLGHSGSGYSAILSLTFRPRAGEAEIRAARACLMRVAAALKGTREGD